VGIRNQRQVVSHILYSYRLMFLTTQICQTQSEELYLASVRSLQNKFQSLLLQQYRNLMKDLSQSRWIKIRAIKKIQWQIIRKNLYHLAGKMILGKSYLG
jgi:hypothetical protein